MHFGKRFTGIYVMFMAVWTAVCQNDELYRCPQGTSGSMFAFQEKCYRFVPVDKHWTQAQSDCQLNGGNLVHIHNQETQNFIYYTAKSILGWKNNGMWIGAHDQRVENAWEWVWGSSSVPGKNIVWSNWSPGQPSCGLICIEHCGQMRFNDHGRWHDVQCHARFFFKEEKYRYCCMYDMRPKTTTTTTTTTTTPAPTNATTSVSTTIATTETSTYINTTTADPPSTPDKSTSPSRDVGGGAVDGERSTLIVGIVAESQGSEQVKSKEEGLEGGTVAGIAIGCLVALCLLLLLLLILMRRRKQKKEDNPPSEKFQNQTYSGAVTSAGPALAYVNPQAESATYLSPTLSVRLPEKAEETKLENPYSECMDNHNNSCAAALESDDDEFGHSKGIYEDIKLDMKSDLSDFDSDEEFDSKNKTPSVEYLHARQLPIRQSPGPMNIPSRNLFSEDHEHVAPDNIYVPMTTGNDNDIDPVYQ